MPEGGGRLVDRAAQVQRLDDARRPQIEVLADQRDQLRIGDLAGAERLYEERERVRHTNRVGDLQLEALRQAGRDDVLGDIARRIGRRAIHLCRILAAERPAAMARHAAVGVHDDLAPRQAGVAHWPADGEAARRIDEELGVCIQHLRRNHRSDDVLDHVGTNLLLGGGLCMLGRDDDRVYAHWPAVLVLHRHLALAVGSQVGERPLVGPGGAAHRRELAGQVVRQVNRRGHEDVGLVAGKADHHALVARADGIQLRVRQGTGDRALARFQRGTDAAVNVRALFANGGDDAAGAIVEAIACVHIADVLDGAPHDLGDIGPGGGGNLAGHQDQSSGGGGFTGDARQRVFGDQGVEHAVADLVAELIRVALGHALARKEALRVGHETVGHRVVPPRGPLAASR